MEQWSRLSRLDSMRKGFPRRPPHGSSSSSSPSTTGYWSSAESASELPSTHIFPVSSRFEMFSKVLDILDVSVVPMGNMVKREDRSASCGAYRRSTGPSNDDSVQSWFFRRIKSSRKASVDVELPPIRHVSLNPPSNTVSLSAFSTFPSYYNQRHHSPLLARTHHNIQDIVSQKSELLIELFPSPFSPRSRP